MEGGAAAATAAEGKPKEETAPSYTYWVREKTPDAAPLPVPRKLNPGDQPNNQTPTHLGSAWNRLFGWIYVELDAVDYNFGSVGYKLEAPLPVPRSCSDPPLSDSSPPPGNGSLFSTAAQLPPPPCPLRRRRRY
nr:uncharacterized protein LOC109170196 isoform X2 [Ipomoea batatas]